jgi:hypothetical protein
MILRLKIITPIDKPKELYKGSFNQLSIDEGFLLFHTHTHTMRDFFSFTHTHTQKASFSYLTMHY